MEQLPIDFTVDKSAKTVVVTKQFDGNLDAIWDAFTTPEMLDKWWAPKPFTSKTKSMEFREGGRRFYAMVSPEGQESWGIQEYTSIHPKTHFSYLNAFADADGNPNLPGSDWDLKFSKANGITTVRISIYNESLERMEKMLEMGFQAGFTMTLNELETLLGTFKK